MTDDLPGLERFWIAENGVTFGPADLATIQSWANEGRITARAMAMREGGSGWLPAASWLDVVFPAHATLAPARPARVDLRPEGKSSRALWVLVTCLVIVIGGPIVGAIVVFGASDFGPVAYSPSGSYPSTSGLLGPQLRTSASQRAEHEVKIRKACEDYREDVGVYPDSVDQMMGFSGPPGYSGPYLIVPAEPVDPYSGEPYELADGMVVGPPVVDVALEYGST